MARHWHAKFKAWRARQYGVGIGQYTMHWYSHTVSCGRCAYLVGLSGQGWNYPQQSSFPSHNNCVIIPQLDNNIKCTYTEGKSDVCVQDVCVLQELVPRITAILTCTS